MGLDGGVQTILSEQIYAPGDGLILVIGTVETQFFTFGSPADPFRLQCGATLDEVTLAEALKPAGYVSCHIGKWNLGQRAHFPERRLAVPVEQRQCTLASGVRCETIVCVRDRGEGHSGILERLAEGSRRGSVQELVVAAVRMNGSQHRLDALHEVVAPHRAR